MIIPSTLELTPINGGLVSVIVVGLVTIVIAAFRTLCIIPTATAFAVISYGIAVVTSFAPTASLAPTASSTGLWFTGGNIYFEVAAVKMMAA